MTKKSFLINSLSIHKIPGFPKGMKDYDDFAPQINIIAGPNGCGKSSTASVIQQLIWQNKIASLNFSGSIDIGNERWNVQVDSGSAVVQRNGIADRFSFLPVPEEYNRYMLALHRLVNMTEDEMARQIVKESKGGYDIEQSRADLGYSSNLANRASKPYKESESKLSAYNDVVKKQREIMKQEEKLIQLYDSRQLSKEASIQKEYYEKVEQVLTSQLRLDNAIAAHAAFPQSLSLASGDEIARLTELEVEIDEAKTEIEKERKIIASSKEREAKLFIPVDIDSRKVITDLEQRIHEIEVLQNSRGPLELEIEKYREEKFRILKIINEPADSETWKGLDLQQVADLEEYFLSSQQVLSEKFRLDQEIAGLVSQCDDSAGDKSAETYVLGIRMLSSWLQEKKSVSTPSWLIFSICVIAAISIVFTFFFGWLTGIAGILIIAAIWFFVDKSAKASSQRFSELRESDYQNTGLDMPTGWSIEEVARKIDALTQQLNTIKWNERIEQSIEEKRNALQKLQPRVDAVEQRRKELLLTLQAVPEISQNTHSGTFYFFIKNVRDWQNAYLQVEGLMAQLNKLQQRIDEELKTVNSVFASANLSAAADIIEANTLYLKLKEESAKKDGEQIIRDRAENNISNLEPQIEKYENKRKEVYERFNIENENKTELLALLNQVVYFNNACNELKLSKDLHTQNEKVLHSHSRYLANVREVDTLTIDVVKRKIIELNDRANELMNVTQQIADIEGIVNLKQIGKEVEVALSDKEQAVGGLAELYDNNISWITGYLITEKLKSETSDNNRPAIFHKAKEYLSLFTSGRYELKLDETNDPSFKAYDTVLKLGQSLDQLSTGTRIQLLLALRLAYIDSQETDVKLPILADEVLGCSDDLRTKTIIESLIRVSKEGRQVFYFTAKSDEVSHWRSLLEKEQVNYKIYELESGATRSVVLQRKEYFSRFAFNTAIDLPVDKPYEEYFSLLKVAHYDLITGEPEELHVWYLLDSATSLIDCIRKGIISWGQLKTYTDNGGKIEGPLNTDETKVKIKILKEFQHLYKKGRPLSIDRSVLIASAAVSSKFMDEVSDQLSTCDDNPVELLVSLKNGDVAGFRRDKINLLEEYLLEKGFIDDSQSLEIEEVFLQLRAVMSNMDIDSDILSEFVNRIMNVSEGQPGKV